MSSGNVPYTPPVRGGAAFNCMFCNAYARQTWSDAFTARFDVYENVEHVRFCLCSHCKSTSIWCSGKMFYPRCSTAPMPNPDLPEDIKNDIEEARLIVTSSPRGAAALLRLAIQKLCQHLGEDGQSLNGDIQSLVNKGLPLMIQQALDTVRVVGNNAVHPGQIDLQDNPTVANELFGLVNIIADVMITQPNKVKSLYETVVPEENRKAITERDTC